MTLEICGNTYYATSTVLEDAAISRQTLWRWRREGLVPKGHRFRNGQLLFTRDEYQKILAYATRIEPSATPSLTGHVEAMR